MNVLYIIDVSSVLYTGQYNKKKGAITRYGVPVGGILKLLQFIGGAIPGTGKSFCLVFDSKTKKKSFYDDYKSGRVKEPSIELQKELVRVLFEQVGFDINKLDSYEADDIIAWACEQNKNKYDDIRIISNDMDLAHNVQVGVSLDTVRVDLPCINENNFCQAVVRGETIQFNTISAHKAIFGCSSDKIPGFESENNITRKQVYTAFCDYLKENEYFSYEMSSSLYVFYQFINSCSLLDEQDKQYLKYLAILAYPLADPGYTVGITEKSESLLSRLAELCTALNDFKTLQCIGYRHVEVSPELKNILSTYAKRYLDGEFSVDNSLPMPGKGVEFDDEDDLLGLDFLKSFD